MIFDKDYPVRGVKLLYICSRGHCMQGLSGKTRSIRGLVPSAPSPLFFVVVLGQGLVLRLGFRMDR